MARHCSSCANDLVPKFMTEDQIVDDVYDNLTAASKDTLRATARSGLISFHFTVGMAIRNKYGLWDPSNPYVERDEEGPNHPDQMSMRIIERVWDRVINQG